VRQLDDLLFYGVLGVIVGGRLGEILFYQPGYYLQPSAGGSRRLAGWHVLPWRLPRRPRRDGLYARKIGRTWFEITDFIAPLVPLGLAAGRIGNFINGELWGRVADPSLPWAMVFPWVDNLPRHPSQLYQAGLEGVALFVVLWLYSTRARPRGAVSGVFLIGYGSLRWLAEYFRSPDDGILGLSFTVSMGQWLSLPMILCGLLLVVLAHRQRI
jgi:phosphatidylglycerol:prolipoprotein diacylglycerol transferase